MLSFVAEIITGLGKQRLLFVAALIYCDQIFVCDSA